MQCLYKDTVSSSFRSLVLMGILTVIGTGIGAYIMAMAVLSPCPLLVHESSGAVLIVSPPFFSFTDKSNNENAIKNNLVRNT